MEGAGTIVETKIGSPVIDVALLSMIVPVVRLEYRVVVLSDGWTIVWRIVWAPYVVVVVTMSVVLVVVDVEPVGSRIEAEGGRVVLNVVVVVASTNWSVVIDGKLVVGTAEIDVF